MTKDVFYDGLDPDTEQRLWDQALAALDADKEEESLESLRTLSEDGDWRASISIAYIFDARGRGDRKNFIVAAHWYSRALSQQDRPEPRLALARYYFFGLGGTYEFRLAFDHLTKYQVEEPEAILMLAELYRNGLGTLKDLTMAEHFYSLLVKLGYPVGYNGHFRLAKTQKRYFDAVTAVYRFFRLAVPLFRKNRKDPRLLGTGQERGDFRRDRFVRRHGKSAPNAKV